MASLTGPRQRKLKEALKKDGLQLSSGSIIAADAEPSPAKKGAEKRKKDEGDDEDNEKAAPSKKRNAKGKAKKDGEVTEEVA